MIFREFDKIKNYKIGSILHIGDHKYQVLEFDWDNVITERKDY